jgi:hypothetical protein
LDDDSNWCWDGDKNLLQGARPPQLMLLVSLTTTLSPRFVARHPTRDILSVLEDVRKLRELSPKIGESDVIRLDRNEIRLIGCVLNWHCLE